MPLSERLSGQMRCRIKPNVISIVILFLMVPYILAAQEPHLPSSTGFGGFEPTCAACNQNENAAGVSDGAGTSNLPVQSTKNDDNDWVHVWMRKVEQVRASQPHFVSPIVTTHVMLVQQIRYDISWQQDAAGGTTTSHYGASI